MNIPENDHFQSIPFIKIGDIKQKNENGRVRFTQKVQLEGKNYNVSVLYDESDLNKGNAIQDLDNSIRKILIIAKNLKLENKGLEKIQITGEKITGHWKDNHIENLKDKFYEKLNQSENKIYIIENEIVPEIEVESDINNKNPLPFANRIFQSFDTHKNEAINFISNIEKIEKEKNTDLLNNWSSAYQSIDEASTLEEIKTKKEELNSDSNEIRETTTHKQKQSFEKLEDSLVQMTKSYNDLVAHRKDHERMNKHTLTIQQFKSLEKQMLSEIKDLNALIGNARLSINKETAITSNVMGIGAVVEKKLSLLERQKELEQKLPSLTKKEKRELKKITAELKKAPEKDFIADFSTKTLEELHKTSTTLVSGKEAKALNKVPPALKWGNSHMAKTLTTPANWTPMRTAAIKESKEGFVHVCVEILEPLNIGEKGGVPSGLRNKAPYDKRTTNFIKTTTYIKQENGTAGNQISYRGGQFPTKEAAKEAITKIIEDNNGNIPDDLHINTLLTPTTNPILKLVRKDSKLLPQHKQSIEDAINELIEKVEVDLFDLTKNVEENQVIDQGQRQEKIKELESKRGALTRLKGQMAISNFGVNQDALGEIRFKLLGIGSLFRLKFGWHTSIRDYSNEAVVKLNGSISRKLQTLDAKMVDPDELSALDEATLKDLDHLGALFSVGAEMEAVWATNDYAEGRGNNSQFKLPALWKTMDGLLGVITYSDCMSGKDRTGWVEGSAKEYSDEIEMNILDQKNELLETFTRLPEELNLTAEQKAVWEAHKKLLTTACFTTKELEELAKELVNDKDNFSWILSEKLDDKIKAVKNLSDKGLMNPKTGIRGKVTGRFFYNTSGIPKTIPKAFSQGEAPFPQSTVSSMYRREPINVIRPDGKQVEILENRQREAVNRRISQLGGSLQVIQKNTSKAGNKENKGRPLARLTSGFDRDYVLYKLFSEDSVEYFKDWSGLHELDSAAAQAFQAKAEEIKNSRLTEEKKVKAYNSLLRQIEKAKIQGLSAQGKVKA